VLGLPPDSFHSHLPPRGLRPPAGGWRLAIAVAQDKTALITSAVFVQTNQQLIRLFRDSGHLLSPHKMGREDRGQQSDDGEKRADLGNRRHMGHERPLFETALRR
jgi:hypothetical protein